MEFNLNINIICIATCLPSGVCYFKHFWLIPNKRKKNCLVIPINTDFDKVLVTCLLKKVKGKANDTKTKNKKVKLSSTGAGCQLCRLLVWSRVT
jgi:hypothetical protein